jgi:hypothetical protein
MFKKLLQISVLITAGLLIGFGCYYKYAQKNTRNPIEYAYNYLAGQEQNAWNHINPFGIDKKTLESKAGEIEHKHIKAQEDLAPRKKHVSENTKKLVLEILESSGIDTKNIKILATEMECAAAASETVVFINEPLLEKYSQDEQLFIIAHEAQHMVYKDYLHNCALKEVLQDKNISYQCSNINDPANCYSRFCELRADVNAALKGKRFTDGFLKFAQKTFDAHESNPGTTHPSDKDRLALAQEIYSAMQAV